MRINFNDENQKLTLPWKALLAVKDVGALRDSLAENQFNAELKITVNDLPIDEKQFFSELQEIFDDRDQEIKEAAKKLIESKLNDVNYLLYDLETAIKEKLNSAGIGTEE